MAEEGYIDEVSMSPAGSILGNGGIQVLKSPAFQYYPKQFLGDDLVLAMDWDARGMHWWLCCLSWQQVPVGSIPDDSAMIRRWLGLPSGFADADRVWARVRPQIFAAWSLRDGRHYQQGMVDAWERQQKRSVASTNNLRIRYQPSTNTQKIEVVKELELGFEVRKPTDEEMIYCEYPRKTKPREAFKAIGNALKRLLAGEPVAPRFASKGEAVAWLRQRVEAYRKAREGQPKEFTPYPASWFNGGSYLEQDENWYLHRENGNGRVKTAQEQRDLHNAEAFRVAAERAAKRNRERVREEADPDGD